MTTLTSLLASLPVLAAVTTLGQCANAPAPDTDPVAALAPPCTLALTGAQVWTGQRFEDRDVFVSSGLFVEGRDPQACDEVVDLAGRYIAPPFAEGHSHNIEAEWSFPGLNARYLDEGVFYVLNPLNMPAPARALEERIAAPETIDVAFAHGGLTSYRGHPEFVFVVALSSILYGGAPREAFVGQAFHTVERLEDIAPALDRLQDQGADVVKLVIANSEDHAARSAYLRDDENWRAIVEIATDETRPAQERLDASERTSVGLDPALVPRIVEAIHDRGLSAIAHIDTATDFEVAANAGVDTIVHMPGIAIGPGNTLESGTLTEAGIAAAVRQGTGVVLTASVRPEFTQEADRPTLHALQRGNIRRLLEAGVPVYIGTDRWQAMASQEVAYLVEIGALTPAEAFKAWVETSRIVFPDRAIGQIAPGFEADLLVFDADPTTSVEAMGSITRRLKGGAWLASGEAG